MAVTKPCMVELFLVAGKRSLKAGAVMIPDITPGAFVLEALGSSWSLGFTEGLTLVISEEYEAYLLSMLYSFSSHVRFEE